MKMFRFSTMALAATAAVALTVAPAAADQIATSAGSYQTGSGGEFTFTAVGGWLDTSSYSSYTHSGNSFQTFCIEAGENVTLGNTYNAQLNTHAMYGGQPAPGDELSQGTGWLYSLFATGNLTGYNYTGSVADRKNSAGLLQQTLWWLEGETNSGGASNVFGLAVISQFGSAAAAMGGSSTTYGVMAVNLWTGNDPSQSRAQDGLFYRSVPDGGATLALLGGALMALGAARRRFMN
ncbi:MAG: VPDSG-CTERM sorting domain-containing protein [Acidobacteria bacterium]|nr:VPDSG-CTERM sorting domain-containing protein [Acidobacteriota bacterium]